MESDHSTSVPHKRRRASMPSTQPMEATVVVAPSSGGYNHEPAMHMFPGANLNGVPMGQAAGGATMPRAQLATMPSTIELSGRFEDDYSLGPEVGRGTYSVVRKCTHKASGASRAVKIIATRPFKLSLSYRGATASAMLDEVRILRALDHEGIIKVYEVYEGAYEGKDAVFVVTELAPGGELFDSIIKAGNFSEPQARHVMWQALATLQYMHDRGVIHRDLKPENLLVFSTVSVPAMDPVVRPGALQHPPQYPPGTELVPMLNIKVADFGVARYVGNAAYTSGATTFVGSPQYVAPEVLFARDQQQAAKGGTASSSSGGRGDSSAGGGYGRSIDVYSLGVILYTCLAGYLPFDDAAPRPPEAAHLHGPRETWEDRVRGGRFYFAPPVWTHISAAAKDLIRRMMEVDPSRRITVSEALAHPWFEPIRSALSPPLPLHLPMAMQQQGVATMHAPRLQAGTFGGGSYSADTPVSSLVPGMSSLGLGSAPGALSGPAAAAAQQYQLRQAAAAVQMQQNMQQQYQQLALVPSAAAGANSAAAFAALAAANGLTLAQAQQLQQQFQAVQTQQQFQAAQAQQQQQHLGQPLPAAATTLPMPARPDFYRMDTGPGVGAVPLAGATSSGSGFDALGGGGGISGMGPLGFGGGGGGGDGGFPGGSASNFVPNVAGLRESAGGGGGGMGSARGGASSASAPSGSGGMPFSSSSGSSSASDLQQLHVLMTVAKSVDFESLLLMQRSAALTFKAAYMAVRDVPQAALVVRRHAVAARELQRKVQATVLRCRGLAQAILALLPDLRDSVLEGDAGLTQGCFGRLRTWVSELKGEAAQMQTSYATLIGDIQTSLEHARAFAMEMQQQQQQAPAALPDGSPDSSGSGTPGFDGGSPLPQPRGIPGASSSGSYDSISGGSIASNSNSNAMDEEGPGASAARVRAGSGGSALGAAGAHPATRTSSLDSAGGQPGGNGGGSAMGSPLARTGSGASSSTPFGAAAASGTPLSLSPLVQPRSGSLFGGGRVLDLGQGAAHDHSHHHHHHHHHGHSHGSVLSASSSPLPQAVGSPARSLAGSEGMGLSLVPSGMPHRLDAAGGGTGSPAPCLAGHPAPASVAGDEVLELFLDTPSVVGDEQRLKRLLSGMGLPMPDRPAVAVGAGNNGAGAAPQSQSLGPSPASGLSGLSSLSSLSAAGRSTDGGSAQVGGAHNSSGGSASNSNTNLQLVPIDYNRQRSAFNVQGGGQNPGAAAAAAAAAGYGPALESLFHHHHHHAHQYHSGAGGNGAGAQGTPGSGAHGNNSSSDGGSSSAAATLPPHGGGHRAPRGSRTCLGCALSDLRQVDMIFTKAVDFWSSMEFVVDVVVRRKEHSETLLRHSTSARMIAKATASLSDYMAFWQAFSLLCGRYADALGSGSTASLTGPLQGGVNTPSTASGTPGTGGGGPGAAGGVSSFSGGGGGGGAGVLDMYSWLTASDAELDHEEALLEARTVGLLQASAHPMGAARAPAAGMVGVD